MERYASEHFSGALSLSLAISRVTSAVREQFSNGNKCSVEREKDWKLARTGTGQQILPGAAPTDNRDRNRMIDEAKDLTVLSPRLRTLHVR